MKITIIQGNYERTLYSGEQLPIASRPQKIGKVQHDILSAITSAAITIIKDKVPRELKLSAFVGYTIKGKNTVTYEGNITINNSDDLEQAILDIVLEHVSLTQDSFKEAFKALKDIYEKEMHTPGRTSIENAPVSTDSIYGIKDKVIYQLTQNIRSKAIKFEFDFEYKLPNGLIQQSKIYPTTSDSKQEMSPVTISCTSGGINLTKETLDINIQTGKQIKGSLLHYSSDFKAPLLESLSSQKTLILNAIPYSFYMNGQKTTTQYSLVEIIDTQANTNVEIEFN